MPKWTRLIDAEPISFWVHDNGKSPKHRQPLLFPNDFATFELSTGNSNKPIESKHVYFLLNLGIMGWIFKWFIYEYTFFLSINKVLFDRVNEFVEMLILLQNPTDAVCYCYNIPFSFKLCKYLQFGIVCRLLPFGLLNLFPLRFVSTCLLQFRIIVFHLYS